MSVTEKKLQSMKSSPGASRGPAAVQVEDAFCKYSHRVCSQNILEGYDFCLRHILEDKSAPFKQCAYMTKAGRKCPAAAPKLEKKEGFCSAHNRKSLLARQRLARKRRPGETGETLLEELVALTSAGSGPSGTSHHEHRRNKMFTDSVASRALEYASSSDSESEFGPIVESTWRDDGDSDAESIDSDQEDLLKYAGVYTSEEVAQILRDKLIRLQALYIDQFKRLKHMLLVKRKHYLKARGPEKEAFGSVKLYKKDPLQKERYKKLKAMQQYHKKAGKEALLQRQSTERRMQASAEAGGMSPGCIVTGTSNKPAFQTCMFVDEGVVCGARAVPLSKYCQKHILHDPCQLLYRPCPFADSQCGRPVPTLLNTQFCSLHQPLPSVVKVEDDRDVTAVNSPECSASNSAVEDQKVKLEIKQEADDGSEETHRGREGGGGDGFLPSQGPQQVMPDQISACVVDGASTNTTTTGASVSSAGFKTEVSERLSPGALVSGEVKMEEGSVEVPTTSSAAIDDVKEEKGMEVGEGGDGTVLFTLGEEEEEDKQGR